MTKKILITGRPGTGKSEVTRALAAHGEAAYDLEEVPGLVKLQLRETGETVNWPEGFVDWKNIYAWNLQETALLQFLAEQNHDLFVSVSATNQEKFYHLFDRIFALTVDDPAELTRRLNERNVHEFGQTEENIRRAVENYQKRTADYLAAGAIPIDNMRPLDVVVDDILRLSYDD